MGLLIEMGKSILVWVWIGLIMFVPVLFLDVLPDLIAVVVNRIASLM